MLSSKSLSEIVGWPKSMCLVALLVRFLPHLLLGMQGHHLVGVTGGRPYWGLERDSSALDLLYLC